MKKTPPRMDVFLHRTRNRDAPPEIVELRRRIRATAERASVAERALSRALGGGGGGGGLSATNAANANANATNRQPRPPRPPRAPNEAERTAIGLELDSTDRQIQLLRRSLRRASQRVAAQRRSAVRQIGAAPPGQRTLLRTQFNTMTEMLLQDMVQLRERLRALEMNRADLLSVFRVGPRGR